MTLGEGGGGEGASFSLAEAGRGLAAGLGLGPALRSESKEPGSQGCLQALLDSRFLSGFGVSSLRPLRATKEGENLRP